MKTLYLDCFSGISGDMFIGALIDAGADPVRLKNELLKLQIGDEYDLKWDRITKNGIASTKFDVVLRNEHAHTYTHHHDDTHHQDQSQEHSYEHSHHHHTYSHEHVPHDHEVHGHSHKNHNHHHQHRSYKDIVNLIEKSGFETSVKDVAIRIFKKIGEAEGKIHGVPLEQVHFHEVGAVDSIIDIVGTAILLDQLDIHQVHSSPIPLGKGRIRIDHGVYPIPAPATLEILKGIPLEQSDVRGELTTPTGAAIVAVLATEFGPIPSFQVDSIGYGAGSKTFADRPNVLRVIIGKS